MRFFPDITVLRERHSRNLKIFFALFYAVGLGGLMLDFSRAFFITLTPFALVLSFTALMLSHQSRWDARTVLIFLLIFLAGFFVEVAGVGTGSIFGEYSYGSGLGVKLFQTPLLIGINWLLLSYCFAALTKPLNIRKIRKVLLGALGMIAFDVALELTAPHLNMWSWSDGRAPLQNYASWFAVAVIFQTALVFTGIRIRNNAAGTILLCQICFFLALAIFFNAASL
jgi:bisanhydrobacterioruberin hydratase